MRTLWTGLGVLSAGMLLAATVQAAAPVGDAANGGKIYMASCSSAKCHVAKPDYMVGQPVDTLIATMQKYKDSPGDTPSAQAMHRDVTPLTNQEMLDIATYLNGLK